MQTRFPFIVSQVYVGGVGGASRIQNRFWSDFGPIWDRFGVHFGRFLIDFGLILIDVLDAWLIFDMSF